MKGILDEMAKVHPALKPWIAWWHVRRSHIFLAFKADGLPAVSLSKMGNASWKRNVPGAMRLVTAAKKDVSTMMMLEKSLKLFNNNQIKSSGRGPSKSAQTVKDRKQQVNVAEDFVNIMGDEEAIMLEAE